MQNFVKCTSFALNFLSSARMRATRTIQYQIRETKNSMQSIRWWKLLKSFHFQGLFHLARWNRISAFLILSKNLRVIIFRGKHHRSNTIEWWNVSLESSWLNWAGASWEGTWSDLCWATCKLQVLQHGSGVEEQLFALTLFHCQLDFGC